MIYHALRAVPEFIANSKRILAGFIGVSYNTLCWALAWFQQEMFDSFQFNRLRINATFSNHASQNPIPLTWHSWYVCSMDGNAKKYTVLQINGNIDIIYDEAEFRLDRVTASGRRNSWHGNTAAVTWKRNNGPQTTTRPGRNSQQLCWMRLELALSSTRRARRYKCVVY